MSKKIDVHIRLNPLKNNTIWKYSNNKLIRLSKNQEILYENFSNILCEEDNHEVYKKCLSNKILEKSNCTVFAYGQTGSGKTYTMLGNKSNGMVMYSLIDLLHNFKLKVSYIEIYNEKLYDLYSKNELKIYCKNDKTIINNLSYITISNVDEAEKFLDHCEKNRTYGNTEFNSKSSRSHTIFQISYFYNEKEIIINLIDLAGSEKASKNESRRTEGAFINKSLLALCTVVNNLRNNKYFGYRDSKLTRLLHNSLDGETNLIALCTLSPNEECVEESISTLNFAARLANLDLKKVVTCTINNDCTNLDLSKVSIHDINLKQGFYVEQFMKLNMVKYDNKIKEINDNVKDETKSTSSNLNNKDVLELKPFVHNIKNTYSKNDKIVPLLYDRIESLEKMLIKILKKTTNKNVKDIFMLEKHMFNLKLKKWQN